MSRSSSSIINRFDGSKVTLHSGDFVSQIDYIVELSQIGEKLLHNSFYQKIGNKKKQKQQITKTIKKIRKNVKGLKELTKEIVTNINKTLKHNTTELNKIAKKASKKTNIELTDEDFKGWKTFVNDDENYRSVDDTYKLTNDL